MPQREKAVRTRVEVGQVKIQFEIGKQVTQYWTALAGRRRIEGQEIAVAVDAGEFAHGKPHNDDGEATGAASTLVGRKVRRAAGI